MFAEDESFREQVFKCVSLVRLEKGHFVGKFIYFFLLKKQTYLKEIQKKTNIGFLKDV
jgi:hypothetical protein